MAMAEVVHLQAGACDVTVDAAAGVYSVTDHAAGISLERLSVVVETREPDASFPIRDLDSAMTGQPAPERAPSADGEDGLVWRLEGRGLSLCLTLSSHDGGFAMSGKLTNTSKRDIHISKVKLAVFDAATQGSVLSFAGAVPDWYVYKNSWSAVTPSGAVSASSSERGFYSFVIRPSFLPSAMRDQVYDAEEHWQPDGSFYSSSYTALSHRPSGLRLVVGFEDPAKHNTTVRVSLVNPDLEASVLFDGALLRAGMSVCTNTLLILTHPGQVSEGDESFDDVLTCPVERLVMH